MDPRNGVIYDEAQLLELDEETRDRLVRIEGSKPDIERISTAVNRVYIQEQRVKARAKNKRAKASRKRNR